MAILKFKQKLSRRRVPSAFIIWAAITFTVVTISYSVFPSSEYELLIKPLKPIAAILPKNGPYLFFDEGRSYHDMNFTCPVAWEWTDDRTKADVVWNDVLGARHATAEDLENARAYPGQLFAFYSLEGGLNHPFVYEAKKTGYDFVVDYRIWPGHPEGMADVPAVYLINPTMPDFPVDFRAPPTLPKRKDAYVAAFISNCNARNNRTGVLMELMEYLPVHSYGRCLHNKDEEYTGNEAIASMRNQTLNLGGQYYFIFAPENSNEVSYVTEKVYKALAMQSVPIYFGAPDIDRFIPHPSAVIHANDFPTTRDLANYLKSLVENEEEYMKLYEWKKNEFTEDFNRILRLATRTVQCRLAMKLAGLDFEADQKNLHIFSLARKG